MKFLINAFLAVFFIDGILSLIHSLLLILTESSLLSSHQSFFGFFVFIFSLIIYILTGINASIPKKKILPLILFLIWAVISAPPLPLIFETGTLKVVLSFIQLFLCLSVFRSNRRTNGFWFFTGDQIGGFAFSFKNTSLFFGINLILIPLLIIMVVFMSLQSFLSRKTAGFLRLAPDGIYMKERIYRKNDKTVRLIGMIHIGEDSYYNKLMSPVQKKSSILMAEGVSDSKGLIKNRLSTKGFAKAYGLQSQEDIDIDGDIITFEELYSDTFLPADSRLKIIRADVDISTFSPDTIAFLNVAGEYIFREDSFGQGVAEYNQWIQENGTPELIASIKTDIIDKRNEKIISLLEPALNKFSLVIVPWGAMHMPAIETAVKEMGFENTETTERRSMAFSAERLKVFASTLSNSSSQQEAKE